MASIYRWLRTQPMTDSIATAICLFAGVTFLAIAALWGLPQ